MKPFQLLSLLLATGAVSALKVQYYYDGGCADYATEVDNAPTGGCYDWQWTGANSANIASLDGQGNCDCNFYDQPGCSGTWLGGASQPDDIAGGNCASFWGANVQSFLCTCE